MSKINQESPKRQRNKKDELIIKDDDLWGRGLPPELLEVILSRQIFVVDIQKFHSVCKTWRSITIPLSPPPPRRLPSPDSSCPLLFQINREDYSKYRLFHPFYEHTWNMDFPTQVNDGPKEIYFSKYGWSLFMVQYASLFLFNPLTQEIKKLPIPSLFFPILISSMFFTCPPCQPDCLVVAISGFDRSIYVHKLGEPDWKKHDLNGKMKMDHHNNSYNFFWSPILYQGLCYCLDWDGNLGVFDIQDIENSWIVHKEIIPLRPDVLTLLTAALVEHNGQLLVVLMGEDHPPCVFELDLETKSCDPNPMRSLGNNNALFISNGASFSQKATISGTGNKIFGPLVLKNKTDHSFRFYSLATSKYYSFFDNLSSDDFCDMEFLPNSSWLPM